MAAKWQRVRIRVPPELGPEERQRFAERAIETIIERTNEGYGVKPGDEGVGKRYRFPSYTKEYSRITGKSRGAVNLRLTSEMLEAIQVLSEKRGQVTIGFENGTLENAKAEGNQIGSYGQPEGNEAKARRFLGLTDKEYQNILEEVVSDAEGIDRAAIQEAASEVISRVRIRG